MKPAPAEAPDDCTAFEEVGRATLQIVHDLKNQLNGLKLYATYLRKRLEREDRTPEERETLAKLIAGLDRAAKDVTALVRYAQPLDLREQPGVDLRTIVSAVVAEAGARETGGLPPALISLHMDNGNLVGKFDPIALTLAIKAITDDIRATVKPIESTAMSINIRTEANDQSAEAVIEWVGANQIARHHSFSSSVGCGTVHTALGAKIIRAHGGEVSCEGDVIRARLPLTIEGKP